MCTFACLFCIGVLASASSAGQIDSRAPTAPYTKGINFLTIHPLEPAQEEQCNDRLVHDYQDLQTYLRIDSSHAVTDQS